MNAQVEFDPPSNTPELLEYYSDAAIHHRTMMIGFLTVYFVITQILLLSPLDSGLERFNKYPNAFLAGAALLATFVLAATMHHACHFCATAGLRALMATHMHFEHLPATADSMNPFVKWMSETAHDVRQVTAIRTFSVVILALLFSFIVAINSYIFVGTAREMLRSRHFDSGFIFAIFLMAQLLVLVVYAVVFFRHFNYLVLVRRELSVVLDSRTKQEVLTYIAERDGNPPTATSRLDMVLFAKRRRKS